MTVFKGFMTITKRNLNILFLYIAIFLAICFAIQKMDVQNTAKSYSMESLDIAVIDRDGGELAKGMASYLEQYHTIKDMPDDKSVIQDRLFYREINYVVTIPKDFESRCLNGTGTLPVIKVPGSTTGYYVDQQIDTFLNNVRVLTTSGFSLPEAIAEVKENAKEPADITLIDKNGHGGQRTMYSFMYQYMPYILLSILCYSLTYIMIAFNKPDVKRRMLCSAVSGKRQNAQLILGYAVIGLAVWGLCTMLPVLMYGKEFFKFAVRKLPESVMELLQRTGTKKEDIKYYVLHQANERIIEAAARRLKEPMEKFPMTIGQFGNTSTASIPLLLNDMIQKDMLKRGDKIIMSGFGAGMTWGAVLMEW